MDFPYIFGDVSGLKLNNYYSMDFENKQSLEKYHSLNFLNRLIPMFEWKGLPDTIPNRIINIQMLMRGYTIIFKHEDRFYATFGGLGGELDFNYMPTIATIAIPYLRISKRLEIHKDCVVIPNDALYMGCMPINNYYSTMMVDNDQSLHCNLIINRLMNLLVAKDEDGKKSLEDVISDLKKGKIASALDDNIALDSIQSLPFTKESSQNIVQLLEHRQYVKGSWWNEWGVQANYNMKRESITSSENILNVDSILPFSDNMLLMRKIGCEELKSLFNLNVSVDFSSSWKKVRKEIELKEKINENEANIEDEKSTNIDKKGGDDNENNNK